MVLTPQDANEMIREAKGASITILGIDAFRLLENDRIQPSMEDSVDYSARGNAPLDVWTNAEKFVIEKARLGLVFEVVIS